MLGMMGAAFSAWLSGRSQLYAVALSRTVERTPVEVLLFVMGLLKTVSLKAIERTKGAVEMLVEDCFSVME